MIIDKNTKRFQTNSLFPNQYWGEEDQKEQYYIIDDNSELANKVKKGFPYIDFILNENNELIDIIITKVEDINQKEIQELRNKIQKLKQKLEITDYQAIKYAEGQLSEEEYAEMKTQRQDWRDEINNLEKQIEELKS